MYIYSVTTGASVPGPSRDKDALQSALEAAPTISSSTSTATIAPTTVSIALEITYRQETADQMLSTTSSTLQGNSDRLAEVIRQLPTMHEIGYRIESREDAEREARPKHEQAKIFECIALDWIIRESRGEISNTGSLEQLIISPNTIHYSRYAGKDQYGFVQDVEYDAKAEPVTGASAYWKTKLAMVMLGGSITAQSLKVLLQILKNCLSADELKALLIQLFGDSAVAAAISSATSGGNIDWYHVIETLCANNDSSVITDGKIIPEKRFIILKALEKYYSASGKADMPVDPVLLAEIKLRIADLTADPAPAQQKRQEAQALLETAIAQGRQFLGTVDTTGHFDARQIAAGTLADVAALNLRYAKGAWNPKTVVRDQPVLTDKVREELCTAERLLAQIIITQACTNPDPTAKIRELESAKALLLQAHSLATGMELQAIKQQLASLLIEEALTLKQNPSLSASVTILQLIDTAGLLLDQIDQWHAELHLAQQGKGWPETDPAWLKELIDQEANCRLSLGLLKDQSVASLTTTVDQARTVSAKLSIVINIAITYFQKKETDLTAAEDYFYVACLSLEELTASRDPSIKAQAYLWLGKIITVHAAYTTNEPAELAKATQYLQQAQEQNSLNPADEAERNKIMGEIFFRQAMQPGINPADRTRNLQAAQAAFEAALTNGTDQVQTDAHLWLAKTMSLLLTDAIRSAEDSGNQDALKQLLIAIQDIIDKHISLVAGFGGLEESVSQSFHKTQADLKLQMAYIYKSVGDRSNYVSYMQQAVEVLLVASTQGSMQTQAEARLSLASALLGMASDPELAQWLYNKLVENGFLTVAPNLNDPEEKELRILTLISSFLQSAEQLVLLSAGQKEQVLKIKIEAYSRSALAWRNLGYADKWDEAIAIVQGLIDEVDDLNLNTSQDLRYTLNLWLGTLTFTASKGKGKDLAAALEYLNLAQTILEENTNISTKQRLRDIYLAQAKVYASQREVDAALQKLDLAFSIANPPRNTDDKYFIAQVMVEKGELLSWGKKDYTETRNALSTAHGLILTISPKTPQSEALRWRIELAQAELEWIDQKQYGVAILKYETIIQEILQSTVSIENNTLLIKAFEGAAQVYSLNGPTRNLKKSRQYAQRAKYLLRDMHKSVGSTSNPFKTRETRRLSRKAESELSTSAPCTISTSVAAYTGGVQGEGENEEVYELAQPQFQEQVQVSARVYEYIPPAGSFLRPITFNLSAAHQNTNSSAGANFASTTFGTNIDYGGMLQFGGQASIVDPAADDSLYFQTPIASLSGAVNLDAFLLFRHLLPVDGSYTQNFDLNGRYMQIAFHPSGYFIFLPPKGRRWLGNLDLSLGAKSWQDSRTVAGNYYNENAWTVDAAYTFPWEMALSFGGDFPRIAPNFLQLDQYNNPHVRFGLRGRIFKGLDFDFSGEWSQKTIPISWYEGTWNADGVTYSSEIHDYNNYQSFYGRFGLNYRF